MNVSTWVRAFALFAVLCWSGSALGQGADLSGRIAYVTPFGQLAIVDPTAGEPRLLSSVGPTYQFPAFAPDGSRIAAIGIEGAAGTVSVFDGATEVERYRSEAERPIYLYWAPDASTLSFIASRPQTGLGFWLAEDGAESRLLETGNPFYWAWSPDGDAFLAHIGLTGEGSRLAFADAANGLDAENLDPPGWFQAPGISPSGSFVAYAIAGIGGSRRVVVASHPRVAGEVVRREFQHDGFAMLGWHPSRDLLAVMAPPQPAPHWFGPIQILDAQDGLLDVVVEDIALAFFWSPDGRKIAYVTPVPSNGAPQVADALGTDILASVAAARASGATLASPGSHDARTAVLSAGRSSDAGAPAEPARVQQGPVELRLRVVYLDGGRQDRVTTIATIIPSLLWTNQFLPFFDQYGLSHSIWSPASDAVVLPVVGTDGVPRVTVFGLDGTRREIAAGDMPFWNVR